MGNFFFWQRWLFYSSIVFAIFGIVFALYGDNPIFHPYTVALNSIFFNTEKNSDAVDRYRAFLYGPLGATIAGMYTMLAFIAYYPFRKKETWAYQTIVVAFGIWVVLDSIVCIYYRVYFQMYMINFFSIIVKALPLIFTYKDFFGEQAIPGQR